MFCAYCGTKLDDGSKFCYRCGRKQFEEEQQEETAQQLVQDDVIVVDTAVEGQEENDQADAETSNLPINQTSESDYIEASETEEEEKVESEEPAEVGSEAESKEAAETVSEEKDEAELEAKSEPEKEAEPEEVQSAGFCAYCGVELEAGSKFCYNCGNAILEDEFDEGQEDSTEVQSQEISSVEEAEPVAEVTEEAEEAAVEPVAEVIEEVEESEPVAEATEEAEEAAEPVAEVIEEVEEVEPVAEAIEEVEESEPVAEEVIEEVEEAEPVAEVTEEAEEAAELVAEVIEEVEETEPVAEAIEEAEESEPVAEAIGDAEETELVAEVIEEAEEEGQSLKFCVYCGSVLEEGAKFCFNCGNEVLEESEETDSVEEGNALKGNESLVDSSNSEVENAEQAESKGSPMTEGQRSNLCSYCGAELEEGAKFCFNCGNEVVNNNEDSQETVQQDQQQTPVEEVVPVEESAPVEETAQVEETVPVEEAAPVEETAQVEETVPVEEAAPVEETAQAEETVPVEEAVPVEETAQAEESVPVEEAAPVEETIQAEEAVPVEEAVQVEKTAQAEEAIPVQETVQAETITPEQDTSAEDKAVLEQEQSYQAPLSIPQDTPKKNKKAKDAETEETSKKSKKGIVKILVAAIIAILILGGFGVYSKITLNHLGDSVETFKNLVQEKGLDNVQEYTSLIADAESKANGFIVFGAGEMEQKIEDATVECESLSTKLADFRAKREEFVNLDSTLLMDEEAQASIDAGLAELDNALSNGDEVKAQEAITSLTDVKTQIETDNKIYVQSLLDEAKQYSNPDFNEEENETLQNKIASVENLITEGNFVKAKEEALSCSVVISDLEAKVEQDKLEAQLAELSAKPESLTIMISDSIYTDDPSRKALEAELKKKLGMDITFQQYANNKYYDAVQKAFESDKLPDVVYLSQDMYKEYVAAGYLVDITDFWNQSELVQNSKFTGSDTMGNLEIDGRLYGFTPQRGNTVVTYVRKSWLEQLGLKAPTNYAEFTAMLEAFTKNKMGDSQKASDTFGMTAPGLLYNAEPYVSFLQQFYQNAYPDLMQDSSGKWMDGFADPLMVDALNRLHEAYAKGLLDPKIANNSIKDAVNAFTNGKCGVISLWEGNGADELNTTLNNEGIFDDVIVLNPISECGMYLEEAPGVFAVTKNCKNPGGIVKYFFEPMLDDNEVQNLWTYGVKGVNWDDKEEKVQYTTDYSGVYEQGQFHALAYKGYKVGTYNYNLIDPLKAFVESNYIEDQYILTSVLAIDSSKVAKQYCKAAPNLKYNETYWSYFSDIQTARQDAIKKVVVDGVDAQAAIDEYNYNIGGLIGEILDEMNQ